MKQRQLMNIRQSYFNTWHSYMSSLNIISELIYEEKETHLQVIGC